MEGERRRGGQSRGGGPGGGGRGDAGVGRAAAEGEEAGGEMMERDRAWGRAAQGGRRATRERRSGEGGRPRRREGRAGAEESRAQGKCGSQAGRGGGGAGSGGGGGPGTGAGRARLRPPPPRRGTHPRSGSRCSPWLRRLRGRALTAAGRAPGAAPGAAPPPQPLCSAAAVSARLRSPLPSPSLPAAASVAAAAAAAAWLPRPGSAGGGGEGAARGLAARGASPPLPPTPPPRALRTSRRSPPPALPAARARGLLADSRPGSRPWGCRRPGGRPPRVSGSRGENPAPGGWISRAAVGDARGERRGGAIKPGWRAAAAKFRKHLFSSRGGSWHASASAIGYGHGCSALPVRCLVHPNRSRSVCGCAGRSRETRGWLWGWVQIISGPDWGWGSGTGRFGPS
uniref:spidroin-1-like n=1 Tax=Panthera onca TaxID=9690 RepID=UPI002953C93E|nr:spidroin-1-like [Panthera onca]